MINLDNLNRQHDSIKEEIDFILNEVEKGSAEIDTGEAALHISRLAGLLKIHLLEEDRFLYPSLLNCPDNEIREMTNNYITEMGNLANEYTEFKNAYNTSNKIKNNMDNFLPAAKQMLNTLMNRMLKEDNGLYRIITERQL